MPAFVSLLHLQNGLQKLYANKVSYLIAELW